MNNSNQEEEKNNAIKENNPINNDNNKSNSLSESISGSNSFNEKDDQISKLKNQLNFLIETLNYEQAIILCKKIYFLLLMIHKFTKLYQIYTLEFMIFQVV